MNRSNFLTVKAITSVAFSGALLAPKLLLSAFGVPLSKGGVLVARLFGVDVLGIGRALVQRKIKR